MPKVPRRCVEAGIGQFALRRMRDRCRFLAHRHSIPNLVRKSPRQKARANLDDLMAYGMDSSSKAHDTLLRLS